MANIIPTEGASGSAPKILNTLAGNTITGNMATIGSIRNSNDKPLAGLRFQSGEKAVSVEVNNNTGGQNGRRGSGGLNNTDLSNALWGIHISANAWNRISINTLVNDGFQVGLSSDTNYTHVRRWTVGGRDTVFGQLLGRNVIVIDSNNTGDFNNGTFNNASVDRFSWTFNTQGGWSNTQSWFFCSHAFRVFKTKAGACGIYGADANLKDFADACVTEAWILTETSKDVYNLHAPFKFGNGVNATTITESNVSITIPTPAKDNGDNRLHYEDDSVPIYADPVAGDTTTLDGFTFNCGIPSVFDFDTNVGADWTWNNLTITNSGQVTIGADHTVSGVITTAGTNRVFLNGGVVDNTVFNCDVTMQTATDLTDVTINGILRINTGAASTLNFSNVTVDDVRNSNASTTLTINATNGSSLPTTDGGTGAGQVNIAQNVQITLTGLPLNVEVRIYEDIGTSGNPIADTEIDGTENTASNQFVFTTSANNDIIIVIFDEQYDPVYLQFNSGVSNSSLPFTLITSRNYLNP